MILEKSTEWLRLTLGVSEIITMTALLWLLPATYLSTKIRLANCKMRMTA